MSKRCVAFALGTAAILLLMAGESLAQSVDEWRATEEGQTEVRTLDTTYDGVTPGSGNTLPKIEELKGKEGTWVTWPGFLMRDELGSRFFIQSTVPLEFTVVTKKNKITIQIKNAKVFLRNNSNPLVTTHFNTPVKRAYLKRRGKNVDVVLEMKTEVIPTVTQSAVGDGYHYMFIDFAPGTYPVAPDERPGSQGAYEAL